MGRPCGERRACPRSQGLDPASLLGCSSPNRNLSSTLPPRFMDSEQTWGCAPVIGTRLGCPVAPGHMSACRNQSSNGYPRRLIIWYLLTAILDTGVHTCLRVRERARYFLHCMQSRDFIARDFATQAGGRRAERLLVSLPLPNPSLHLAS